MEKTKKCFKCGEVKSLSMFYKHKKMGDGHLNKCKDCTKKDTKSRTDVLLQDPVWVEKEKERHRKKYHRLGYKELHKPDYETKKETMSRYKNKYPEKVLAKNVTSNLPREKGVEFHHWSYNKEHIKDVIPLEKVWHAFLHRYITYDQERYMYRCTRTLGDFCVGDLLDTKEAHKEYFNLCKTNIKL